jgi:heme-degrading monooxygenase HmoA
MVTIGMNYKVLPGKEATFETAFRNVIQAMRNIEGHKQTIMCRDIDDAQSYVILSEWTEKGAFEKFIGSDAFRSVVSWGKENILAGRPAHTYYDH